MRYELNFDDVYERNTFLCTFGEPNPQALWSIAELAEHRKQHHCTLSEAIEHMGHRFPIPSPLDMAQRYSRLNDKFDYVVRKYEQDVWNLQNENEQLRDMYINARDELERTRDEQMGYPQLLCPECGGWMRDVRTLGCVSVTGVIRVFGDKSYICTDTRCINHVYDEEEE